MRRFILNLVKFCLPLLIVVGGFLAYAEYTLQFYPSEFQLKAQHLKKDKDKIDVLILGSSHNQNAINPEYVEDFNCSNLAFGGQDIRIDSALFNEVIEQLSGLKFVVFEISYHTLEYRSTAAYHRNSLYLRFYGLNLFGRDTTLKDYSIYLSNPKVYNRFLNPLKEKAPVNEYGFSKIPFSNKFKDLKYNEAVILRDTASNRLLDRHKYENIEVYKMSTSAISYMIDKCIQLNIVPIIISPPVYKSYYDSYLESKEKRRKDYLRQLVNKYPSIVCLDYEQDDRFEITDFMNEDHLDPAGAVEFSKLLNDTLVDIKARIDKDVKNGGFK